MEEVLRLAACALLLSACIPRGSTEDEVRAVLAAQQAAWNSGDVEGFMSAGYWRSPELTFLSGGSWTHGYDEVLARYRARYTAEGREMGSLAFTDVEVLPLGTGFALARGRWRLALSDGGELGGLFSLLLERRAEGWRIVHDHTSSDA